MAHEDAWRAVWRDGHGRRVAPQQPDGRSYDEHLAEAVLCVCAGCGRPYVVANALVQPWRCWRCVDGH